MALRASLAGPPLLGFAGELTDPSGLIYLRSRWYEPSVGRFLARDPFAGGLHQPSSLNGFAYVGGRPTMLVDPLGLDPAAARSNWAYTVAQIFADLDSPDPFQRTTAQIIIVAGGLAVSGFLVAGVATLVPSGVAAAKATTAAGIAVGANIYVIGENALQRVVPFATAIGASTMPAVSGSAAFKDAATRYVVNQAMNAGKIIIDLGRDPARGSAGLRVGQYYLAELQEVAERGYTRVIQWRW